MYVGRVMRTDLVTVPPDTSLVKAKDIITAKRIAHLLVVDKKDKLIGIVSDRDLKQSWASPATTLSAHELNYLLKQLSVDMIMVKKIVTIPPDTTIERAAHIMQENRISALPVLQDEDLVGIITTTDVMEILLEAIGIDGDSKRFTVLVEDRIGIVAEVSRVLKEQQVNIRSLVTWPEKGRPGVYHLVMRVAAAHGEKAVSALTKAGYKVLTEYVEDLSPYLPKP
ncbi:MAG: CBS and ACT domain-containing protein [Thermodesulfobacteriota bacterium]|nr:CBS and ACT domain-containing protein [Thermodesulfobacteriota bacterium]